MTPDKRPLSGITVVDFSRMIGPPGATVLLADLGADVIKVEPLGGDPARLMRSRSSSAEDVSAMYLSHNRGKRSIALDLGLQQGRKIARRLVADCDVLVENFRPGVADRLGLGSNDALQQNPRLIHATLTAFGSHSRRSQDGGVDIVMQAESGIMSVTGAADGPPTKAGFTVIDAATSYLFAFAIVSAILQRERYGCGSHIATSLADVGMHMQLGPFSEFLPDGDYARTAWELCSGFRSC